MISKAHSLPNLSCSEAASPRSSAHLRRSASSPALAFETRLESSVLRSADETDGRWDGVVDEPHARETVRGFASSQARNAVRALKEFGLEQLTAEHGFGPRFNFGGPLGLGLAIRLTEKVYAADDEAITEDSAKQVSNARIAAEGQHALWFETGGLAELGAGMSGTIPLGAGFGINAGFDASGVIKYRSLRPYAYSGSLKTAPAELLAAAKDVAKSAVIGLPLTPEAARHLPPGAEVEIVGSGKVSGLVGLQFGASQGLGGLEAAVGLRASASGTLAGQLSLKITGLDGEKMVRVVISNASEFCSAAQLMIRACATVDVPVSAGTGLLSWIVNEESGQPVIDDLVSQVDGTVRDTLGLELSFEMRKAWEKKALEGFVLDLSVPTAREAFKKLIMLSTGEARALSENEKSGVLRARYDETTETTANIAALNLFGQKAFLRSTLMKIEDGTFVGPDGQQISTHEEVFQKKFRTLFSGSKEIAWGATTVDEGSKGERETYYALKFKAHDKLSFQQEVDVFRRFFGALQSVPEGVVDAKQEPMSWWRRFFGHRDDTKTSVQIYFTPDAVARLDAAGYGEGFSAYTEAAGRIHPPLAGFSVDSLSEDARSVFDAYKRRKDHRVRSHVFEPCAPRSKALKGAYAQETARSLAADYGLFRNADAFGRRLAALVQDQGPAVSRFFIGVGRASGLDYMVSIAALARIAGPDDTLVHELSMTGKTVRMVARDEGTLEVFNGEEAVAGVDEDGVDLADDRITIVPATIDPDRPGPVLARVDAGV